MGAPPPAARNLQRTPAAYSPYCSPLAPLFLCPCLPCPRSYGTHPYLSYMRHRTRTRPHCPHLAMDDLSDNCLSLVAYYWWLVVADRWWLAGYCSTAGVYYWYWLLATTGTGWWRLLGAAWMTDSCRPHLSPHRMSDLSLVAYYWWCTGCWR